MKTKNTASLYSGTSLITIRMAVLFATFGYEIEDCFRLNKLLHGTQSLESWQSVPFSWMRSVPTYVYTTARCGAMSESHTNSVHTFTLRCLDICLYYSVTCFYVSQVTAFFSGFPNSGTHFSSLMCVLRARQCNVIRLVLMRYFTVPKNVTLFPILLEKHACWCDSLWLYYTFSGIRFYG